MGLFFSYSKINLNTLIFLGYKKTQGNVSTALRFMYYTGD